MKIQILDSTLREGAQAVGVAYSVNDKIKIVKALDSFGIDIIEAGFPNSSPKEVEFFNQLSKLKLANSKISSFGGTKKVGTKPCEDENLLALLGSNTEYVTIFGKAWDIQIDKVLQISNEQNLQIIAESIAFLKSKNKKVIFDAEHYFDGYFANKNYALNIVEVAFNAGADVVTLCDTNGGTLPQNLHACLTDTLGKFNGKTFGIHCHNDAGCATANTLIATNLGVTHIQGTMTGLGERCGNTDLSEVLPSLKLKMDLPLSLDLTQITSLSNQINEISNILPNGTKAYVGKFAFTHKAGMHIDAMNKYDKAYEHILPKCVGNSTKLLVSDLSGRASVLDKLKLIMPEITKNSQTTKDILNELKQLEYSGYAFEGADASLEILFLKHLNKYKSHFDLVKYITSSQLPSVDEQQTSSAIVHIKVGSKKETAGALGNGPVNALDIALRKALVVFFPQIANIHLTDYKVRVLENEQATTARVRVLIESTDGINLWTTVGVSTDIIEASWLALTDAIEYKLNVLNN
ncbi:MAG: citramalate synthase [Clostridia bacterium]